MYRTLTVSFAFLMVLAAESDLVAQVGKTYEYTEQGRRYAGSDERHQHYQPEYNAEGHYRQPSSMVLTDNERALIATKLTGEIYEFDLRNHLIKVVIKDSSRQFGAMISVGKNRIAVADCKRDEVAVYQREPKGKDWKQVAVLKIPGCPNGLFYDAQQGHLWATSTWGQRLFQYELLAQGDTKPKRLAVIDLPMCGGQVICIPQRKVVLVTDAFGRDFVAVDQPSGSLVNHDQLYEHNICQLVAVDGGESILFPQQLLNELSAALQTDITWGNFLSNNLRWVKTERLLSSSGSDIYNDSTFVPIGLVGNGAGDPTSMAIAANGVIAVTIGGTSQVAIGSMQGRGFRFVDVGHHPVDCEFTADGSSLLVVNQFSDSLAIVDPESLDVQHLSLGPVREPTEVERGEQLFHDSTLSHDGWMSCQSCHSGGHTNGLLTDNFTDNSYRSPKRVLSLLGQRDTNPYSWAGTMESFEDQIAFSIRSTMASDHAVQPTEVSQIAEYLRTLDRPPSITQARTESIEALPHSKDLRRGEKVFKSAGCIDCHRKPLFTSEGTYDVGLQDERSMREFNPPSLIAVSQRQNSLMHDGRAKSIRDVIEKENHQMPDNLTQRQRDDLIEYLKSL